jgi:two-component system, response regulator PdtaR
MRPIARKLRVAVADDEHEIVEYLRDVVEGLGHVVTASCTSGTDLVRACAETVPDLIITDIKMPGLDGIEAAAVITRHVRIPVILVTSFSETDMLSRALRGTVLAYLIKPINPPDLEVAIALSLRRFREFQAVQDEATRLRQALDERKHIEQAKGILMRRAGLGEEEAHKRLQRLSTEQSKKLSETAKMVIAVENAYRPTTVSTAT